MLVEREVKSDHDAWHSSKADARAARSLLGLLTLMIFGLRICGTHVLGLWREFRAQVDVDLGIVDGGKRRSLR